MNKQDFYRVEAVCVDAEARLAQKEERLPSAYPIAVTMAALVYADFQAQASQANELWTRAVFLKEEHRNSADRHSSLNFDADTLIKKLRQMLPDAPTEDR